MCDYEDLLRMVMMASSPRPTRRTRAPSITIKRALCGAAAARVEECLCSSSSALGSPPPSCPSSPGSFGTVVFTRTVRNERLVIDVVGRVQLVPVLTCVSMEVGLLQPLPPERGCHLAVVVVLHPRPRHQLLSAGEDILVRVSSTPPRATSGYGRSQRVTTS